VSALLVDLYNVIMEHIRDTRQLDIVTSAERDTFYLVPLGNRRYTLSESNDSLELIRQALAVPVSLTDSRPTPPCPLCLDATNTTTYPVWTGTALTSVVVTCRSCGGMSTMRPVN